MYRAVPRIQPLDPSIDNAREWDRLFPDARVDRDGVLEWVGN